jgi:predicted esterase
MAWTRGWLVAAFVAAACSLGACVVLYRRAQRAVIEMPVVAATSSAAGGLDDPPADWCAPGFEPIRGAGCFASPGGKPSAPLIVYLHGRYARDAASEEVDRQRRLAVRATALGFAVLALRGRLGACTAPELATWYCWPSNGSNADAGPEFVGAWTTALAAAEPRVAAHPRFLLGFSNGGYFAGLVASHAWLDVDAIVVAHGGPVEPVRPLRSAPPLLLLSADDDVAQDEMIRFDEALTREHWAHDSYARAGGHALADVDIDAALTFFSRAREALPLQPPLSLHRAVRHVRDAGASDEIQANETQGTAGSAPAPQATVSGDVDAAAPVDPTSAESDAGPFP